MTSAQITTARGKGWIPLEHNGSDWVEMGASSTFKKGDVNGDGKVNGDDLNILINILLGKDQASNYGGRANVDSTGEIDGNDLNALINILLGKN